MTAGNEPRTKCHSANMHLPKEATNPINCWSCGFEVALMQDKRLNFTSLELETCKTLRQQKPG